MNRRLVINPAFAAAAVAAAIAKSEAEGFEVVRVVQDEFFVAPKHTPAAKMKDGRTHPWRAHSPRAEPTNAEKIIPRRHSMLKRGKP